MTSLGSELYTIPPNPLQTPVKVQDSTALKVSVFVSVCYPLVKPESNLPSNIGLVA